MLNAITNPNYVIAIQDDADTILNNLTSDKSALWTPALNNSLAITSVSLDMAATADEASSLQAFDLISSFDVADSAEDISTDFSSLANDTKITSISITDSLTPMLTLTVDEALEGASTLAKIAGDDYLVDIVDTAADISDQRGALRDDSRVVEINGVSVVPPAGTGSHTIVQAFESMLNGDLSGPVDIVDTAQNVSDHSNELQSLFGDGAISLIQLSDEETPALTLSIQQIEQDEPALSLIAEAFNLIVRDTAANLCQAVSLAGGDGFAVPGELVTPAQVDCIGPSTATQAATLQGIAGISAFDVTDTAAEVSDNLDSLNNDTKVSSITLTDNDTPTLYLTVAQALNDTTALGKISNTNTNYQIFIVDTAADVAGAIDALNGDAKIASIALTDPGTPALNITAEQAQNDAATLRKITTGYTLFSLPPGPM